MVVVSLDLHKAREALKRAKLALREAEEQFDQHCGVGSNLPLISRVRAAERRVAEARENLRKLDPRRTE
jgi:hypothetical protein